VSDRDAGRLSPELAELYEAERAAPAGSERERRAIRQRLAASVARRRARVPARVAVASGVLAAASLALLVALHTGRNRSSRRPDAAPPRAVERATAPPPARAAAATGAPAPAEPRAAAPPAQPPARRTGEAGRSQAALLEDASRALAAGDGARALELIEQDARGHAGGALAEERDALRIEALLSLGRVEEARSHARAFARAYPASVHQRLIERTLQESEETP
jgi:hypothetical protein